MEKLERLLVGKFERGLDTDGGDELASLLEQSAEARAYYFDYCELHAMLEADQVVRNELLGGRLPDNVVALPGGQLPAGEAGALGGSTGAGGNCVEGSAGMSRGWMLAAAATVVLSLLVLTGVDLASPGDRVVQRPAPTAATGLPDTQGRQGSGEVASTEDASPVVAVEKAVPSKAVGPGDGEIPRQVTEGETKPAKLVPVHAEVVLNGDADIDPMAKYEAVALTAVQTGSLKRPPTQFSNAGSSSGKVSFNRDIRPLLSDKCYSCHGPDEQSRKADLRLDLEEGVFAERGSDEPVLIQRGDPAKSDLYRRLIAQDPDDLMPPKDSHKSLTTQEIATMKKWIEEGAEWESHWAYIPPTTGDLPQVDGEWGVNGIDHYVLAALEKEGLQPSPEADRRTLVRRVTFDTTGLPPTPEEVEDFVNDRAGDAYGKLVDRLLDSPRYGEHRARYWLDAARYGDTHGLHLDNYRSIWPYRDWVVDAYNRNLPFDQFTIEQLAGDLLPSPTQEQLVATGFNRCNVTTSEGGSIPEEFLSRYAIDRVATMGSTWLGMTLGCAQCHDHKFDPVSAKEFYQLLAFFNNTTQPGMDGNSMESPPSIRVYPTMERKKKAEALAGEIAAADKRLDEIKKADKAAFEAWAKDADRIVKDGRHLRLEGALLEQALSWETEDDPKGLGDVAGFSKSQPFSIHLHFKAPTEPGRAVVFSRVDEKNGMRGYRLVWEDQGLSLELIEKWPDRTLRRGTSRRFKEGAKVDVVITYDGSGVSEGIEFYYNGKLPGIRFLRNWADTMEGDFDSTASLRVGGKAGAGTVATSGQDLQFYKRRLNAAEVQLLYTQRRLAGIAKKGKGKRSGSEKGTLEDLFGLATNGEYRKAFYHKAELETRRRQIVSRAPQTLVWEEKDGEPRAWVLDRGEYDKKGEEVGPAVPAILHPMADGAPRNRLGLANWLVDAKNPLTARVMVNRFWGEVFGTGLVTTVGDFGAQGTTPSHPELLDWLALEFMESGWDVKATYRKILMSATYRQSSRVTPELREKDPANRWLARGPRFRLDAEMIRDQALASAGVLLNKMGGPGVKPYQPAGLWQAVGYTGSNTQTYSQDHGKALYRRSIYTLIKRTAPPPNMSLFNAPNRESCVVARERTNTPLQALALMNDVQYIDAARHLAVRTVGYGETVGERIDYLSKVLLARPLSGDDLAVMKDSYHAFEESYRQDPAAAKALNATAPGLVKGEVTPVELASWIMLASQMLNLDEVINKN